MGIGYLQLYIYAMKQHEQKILEGLAAGKTAAEIAGELGLSVRTMETYIVNLREKYEAKNSAHLVAIAKDQKVIA